MPLESLIKNPTLTRELDFELSGVIHFIDDEMARQSTAPPFADELQEFKDYSTRLRLFHFPVIYNDLEGYLRDIDGEVSLAEFRKRFRMKFPYLAALDQIVVFFLPADKQPCAMFCFFLSEVLTRIMDVHGQSKKLTERYHQVERYYRACKMPRDEEENGSHQIHILNMPSELFDVLKPTLGQKSVLSLYQRTFDKLQSQYSNIPSFVFLQSSMERIFTGHS